MNRFRWSTSSTRDGGRHTFSLDVAQAALARADAGVIVLLHRPESGQDILATLREPIAAQRPAARWDPRTYGIGAQILRDLGVGKMKSCQARGACRA
jgi:3,4-dihydroxy 2-butanone 4-phosphate synthase/GTP cyclohydrolase II